MSATAALKLTDNYVSAAGSLRSASHTFRAPKHNAHSCTLNPKP